MATPGRAAKRNVDTVGCDEAFDLGARQFPMRDGEIGGGVGVSGFDQVDELVMLVGGKFALRGKMQLARIVEGHADAGVVDQQAAQDGMRYSLSAISPMIEWKRSLPSARSAASAVLDGLTERPLPLLQPHDLRRASHVLPPAARWPHRSSALRRRSFAASCASSERPARRDSRAGRRSPRRQAAAAPRAGVGAKFHKARHSSVSSR